MGTGAESVDVKKSHNKKVATPPLLRQIYPT